MRGSGTCTTSAEHQTWQIEPIQYCLYISCPSGCFHDLFRFLTHTLDLSHLNPCWKIGAIDFVKTIPRHLRRQQRLQGCWNLALWPPFCPLRQPTNPYAPLQVGNTVHCLLRACPLLTYVRLKCTAVKTSSRSSMPTLHCRHWPDKVTLGNMSRYRALDCNVFAYVVGCKL